MSQDTMPLLSTGGPEQAEAWLARLLAPDCTPAERAAFEAWLAASPTHIEAYLETETVHSLVGELAADPLLRASARRVRREGAGRAARLGDWAVRSLGLAAALALVVGTGAVVWLAREPGVTLQTYATAVGEQRRLTLSDGTEVRLDADSAVVARYTDRQREVEVERGRVQFVVAEDAERPFRVEAGPSTIRDIGTTFQVDRTGERVTVGLIEGAVIVTASGSRERSLLAPGQAVEVDARGAISAKRPFDLDVAHGWTRGQLVFKQRRLDQLVAEMNRYSRTPLRLGDPELEALTVSGVFNAGDQASLVAALEQGWSLKADRSATGEIVLRKAH